MLARLDHGAVDLRERVGKRGQTVRQGLALEHARPHRGEKRTRSSRFGLLDEHVEALFDVEPGAVQRSELALDVRQTLARKSGAREALALSGMRRRGARDSFDR